MVKVSLQHIDKCKATRPDGYSEALLAAGTVNGNTLSIDHDKLEEIVRKFTPERVKTVKGLGDLIHKVANPIAKAIDSVAGTNVQGCGGCAKRRESLNKLMPFNAPSDATVKT
jgi:hypothetical protein